MKQGYKHCRTLDVCGILDTNDDGEYIVCIEEEDGIVQLPLNHIAERLVGETIQIKSSTDLGYDI